MSFLCFLQCNALPQDLVYFDHYAIYAGLGEPQEPEMWKLSALSANQLEAQKI